MNAAVTASPAVDIALATYQGARYLPEQLASFAAQDYPIVHLRVSDDGSADETLALVRAADPRLEVRVADTTARKGILRNFEQAILLCDAPYVALSDQDDVWDPRKISLSMEQMAALERVHGRDMPLLVFCDIEVVDAALRTIDASFFQSTRKSADAREFRDFVLNNHVPGCAMLVNRALLDRALPFPDVAIHDHWLIQTAALLGKIGHVPVPLIKYRQHGANSIGLGAAGKSAAARVKAQVSAMVDRPHRWRQQASAVRASLHHLAARYGASLRPADADLIDAVLESSSPRRLHALLKHARTGERAIDYWGALLNLRATRGSPRGRRR